MNKPMAVCLVFIVMTFAGFSVASGGTVSDPIPLWPKGAPGEKGDIGKEHDTSPATGQLVAGKRVIRLGDVSQPTITVYSPAKDQANDAAVIVCPGGGYSILAMDLEGTEVCTWLNSIGVTAVLLKYRVPVRAGDEKHKLPLQDAQRAVGLVRARAAEWNIDPNRIGILGFSAGGHLMGHLCNDFTTRAYEPVDGADQVSCRPDFALGIYVGLIVPIDDKKVVPPELIITSNAPPTFLVQSQDDVVHVENSLYYYLALKNAHVPTEMHLYAKGGHGYGLRPSKDPVGNWPKLAEAWMRDSGWLSGKQP